MAKQFEKSKIPAHMVCRKATGKGAGKFVAGSKCGLKTDSAPKKTTKKKGRKKAAKKRAPRRRVVKGYYLDKAGRCRKQGKRGYAKSYLCKRVGLKPKA